MYMIHPNRLVEGQPDEEGTVRKNRWSFLHNRFTISVNMYEKTNNGVISWFIRLCKNPVHKNIIG